MQTKMEGFCFDFQIEEGEHALNLARNMIAEEAIESGVERVVMIDKDHPWTPAHLVRILSHAEPIVAGLYCKKRPGKPFWLGRRVKGATPRADGLLAAEFVPTGFLSISVLALLEMERQMPEREYFHVKEDGTSHVATEFFPIGIVGPNTAQAKLDKLRALARDGQGADLPLADLKAILDHHEENSGRLLGEDYFFSHLARKCGIPLFIDTKLIIPHVGPVAFPILPEMVGGPSEIPEGGYPENGFTY